MNGEHNREIRIHALSMDEKLLSLLRAPCWSAELHSCFKGAFNLVDRAGNLLIFLPASCCNGPHRVILDLPRHPGFLELPLSRGDRFTVRDDQLCAGEGAVRIDFGHSRPWTGPAAACSPSLLEPARVQDNLHRLLQSLPHGAADEDAALYSHIGSRILNLPVSHGAALSPLHRRLAFLCDDILRGISAHDVPAIKKALSSLIGLGKGLTPSGDDILSGFISALHCFHACAGAESGPAGEIIRWFSALPGETETTFISRHFMAWIAQGRISEDLRRFVTALCCEAGEEPGPYLVHFASLGASSGREMMVGVALAMYLLIHWMPCDY